MRLVSNDIKQFVDNNISYTVFFFSSTTDENFVRLEKLRIRACTLNCTRIPNFSFPLLIKLITFTEVMRSENVQNVLKLCLHVQRIRFSISTIDENVLDVNFDYGPIWANLSKLSGIELIFPDYVRTSNGSVNYVSVFEVIVRRATHFPRLDYFCISYPMYSSEWSAMLKFLVRNSSSLRSLTIQCKSCIDTNAVNLRLLNDVIHEKCITKLKSFSFTCDVNNCDALFAHTWSHDFAMKQKTINNLRLISKPLDYLSVKCFFPELSSTLRRLDLLVNSDNGVESENAFLEHCPNLTEVKLVCVPYVNTSTFSFGSAINFNPNRVLSLDNLTFPHVIVRLCLEGCFVETASIISMCDAIKNLQELGLYHIGPPFSLYYGLTIYCAVRILNLPDIKTFSFSRATLVSPEMNSDEWKLWKDVFDLALDYGIYHDSRQSGRAPENIESKLNGKHRFKVMNQDQRLNFVVDLNYITRNRML